MSYAIHAGLACAWPLVAVLVQSALGFSASFHMNSSKLVHRLQLNTRQAFRRVEQLVARGLHVSSFSKALAGFRVITGGLLESHNALLQNGLIGLGRTGLAVYIGHDSSIAVSKHGRVQCVLELERLFNIRYFHATSSDSFATYWRNALNALRKHCPCEGEFPTQFDFAVFVPGHCEAGYMCSQLPLIVEEFFEVRAWHSVEHHEAHAALGFFGSSFRSSLVVSYDGGGSDGTFNVYLGFGNKLERIAKLNYNFGATHLFLANFITEVTHIPLDTLCHNSINSSISILLRDNGRVAHIPSFLDSETLRNSSNWTVLEGTVPIHLSYSGKLMGYAALGTPDAEVGEWIREAFVRALGKGSVGADVLRAIPDVVLRKACASVLDQRSLAASIQREFELLFRDIVAEIFEQITGRVEGIVLTGGCALNVLVNQLIYDIYVQPRTLSPLVQDSDSRARPSRPLKMYVPPSPNDSGLTVGALWAVDPPATHQALQYLGFPLWDRNDLFAEAQRRNARDLTFLGGIEFLADLLAGGLSWVGDGGNSKTKPIIAVVRGRQEFGPRALGHRSLLAVPDSSSIRDRLNKLKFREWYRPVAPMIAEEALLEVFGRFVKSPYMSMAPQTLPDIKRRFPGIVHLDGTARHQSVGHEDESWLHELLLAVGKKIGLAALINTSFNSKGKPIVNTVGDCMQMLDELPELDYVLIENWLFKAPHKKAPAQSEQTYDDHWPEQIQTYHILKENVGSHPWKMSG